MADVLKCCDCPFAKRTVDEDVVMGVLRFVENVHRGIALAEGKDPDSIYEPSHYDRIIEEVQRIIDEFAPRIEAGKLVFCILCPSPQEPRYRCKCLGHLKEFLRHVIEKHRDVYEEFIERVVTRWQSEGWEVLINVVRERVIPSH